MNNVCSGGGADRAAWVCRCTGRFFGLSLCHAGDGTVIEREAVWAEATRITSQDAGATAEARYTLAAS